MFKLKEDDKDEVLVASSRCSKCKARIQCIEESVLAGQWNQSPSRMLMGLTPSIQRDWLIWISCVPALSHPVNASPYSPTTLS